jgi:molecular chaperone DnaJ
MQKNYYVVLGISSDASIDEVKTAFRRRALELHPDTSGLGSAPFIEAQEAYGVLADPERRRRHDSELRSFADRPRQTREPLVRPRPQAEPFRSVEVARAFRDGLLAESFASYRPSFEELFDRWWGNFDSITRPKSETLESLTVEVVIGSEEARRGGSIQVGIPARATCPACGGHGAMGLYECWRCEGHGAITTEYPIEVAFPPAIRDGYAVRVPLTRYGIENFYLTVLVRLGGGES